jgi:peptide/nickel transport system substrate-binding protein
MPSSGSRWPLLLVLGLGVAAVLGFWYVATRPSGQEMPAPGGVYVEGVAGGPSRVNPLFASFNAVDVDLASLVFSGLVRLAADGHVVPDLAERWEVSDDGTTYTFELRQGLLWHDGEAFDASDVAFTLRATQDPEFRGDPALAALFRDVDISTPDHLTVVLTLPQPFAPFLAYATVGILPKHLLGGLDAEALYDSEFNQRPVGTGPFRLLELSSNGAVLEGFPSYHLGQPYLERLELRFFRDEGELLTALRSRQIDGALFRPGLSADDVFFLDSQSYLSRYELHTTGYLVIYLNQEVEPFRDPRVRRALQHALDRDAVAQVALAGQGLPVDSPIPPDTWAYRGAPDAFRFDRAQAEALLDGAGWRRGSRGLREKDGEALRFTLVTNDEPPRVAAAQEVARQWAELGIEVTVAASGSTELLQEILVPQEFEAVLFGLETGADPDPYPLWHSTQMGEDGRNLAGFSHAEADRLMEEARLTTDVAQRVLLYQRFQEIFVEELPVLLLYSPAYSYVVDIRFQGLNPGVLVAPASRFRDVHLWFTETRRVE